MRALFTTHRSVNGGAQRALAGLVRHLDTHGIAPRVAIAEPGPLEGWLDCEVVRLWRSPGAMEEALRGVDVAVGICSQGHNLCAPAAAAAGVPVMWWRVLTPLGRPHELEALGHPAVAVACPNRRAAALQRVLTPHARVEHVPPGAPVEEIAARAGCGRRLRTDDRPLVGIVGRVDPWKGQDVFLEAAALVPEARFVVVGGAILGNEGDFEREVHALAHRLGLADRVLFTGHVDDAIPWLDALDVAVLASSHEAFGIVLVEAMALGTPVIATATDGPSEVVEDGVSGLLVPVGDPRALAAAMVRVLRDRSLASALAEAGRRRAREFTEERTAARFARLLRDVAASAQPREALHAVVHPADDRDLDRQ
jgi:glycosyltransferase involved in cell wall biosynthesis